MIREKDIRLNFLYNIHPKFGLLSDQEYSQRYAWEKQRAVGSPLTREDQGSENCHYQLHIDNSEMNITGTLPQAGNLKLFVPSLSTQSSTRLKQNIFNVVLMRPDKTE